MVKENKLYPNNFWGKHGIKTDKGIIGVIASWPDGAIVTLAEMHKQFTKAFEVAEKLNLTVVIKAHPLQDVESVKRWMDDLGIRGYIVRDCNLLDFCASSLLIVSPLSSAVVQAMMAEIPVVHFQLAGIDKRNSAHLSYGFANHLGVRCITDGEDSFKIIKELILDPDVRQAQVMRGKVYVEQHVGPVDGFCSQRFLAALDASIQHVKPV